MCPSIHPSIELRVEQTPADAVVAYPSTTNATMDDQEAPPAVHGGGEDTSSSAAPAAPFPPAEKVHVDMHHEVGATSPSTEKKKYVPATATTTAPFAATAAAAATDPSDSDPENVGMPIEGDEVAFDASGFSGGECVSLLVCLCRLAGVSVSLA